MEMMLDGDLYLQRFTAAVDKSESWGCTHPGEFEPLPDGATLKHYLDAIDFFIEKRGEQPDLRTACSQIHFQLWDFLRQAGLPTVITIGDMAKDGTRTFDTSYALLKKELRGANLGSSAKINYHVWLTLPHGQTIIDLTALPFFAGGLVPGNWKHLVYISEYVNADEEVEHIPYLVGVQFLLQSGAVQLVGA